MTATLMKSRIENAPTPAVAAVYLRAWGSMTYANPEVLPHLKPAERMEHLEALEFLAGNLEKRGLSASTDDGMPWREAMRMAGFQMVEPRRDVPWTNVRGETGKYRFRRVNGQWECTCPSRENPCKHGRAYEVLEDAGGVPAWVFNAAESNKYALALDKVTRRG